MKLITKLPTPYYVHTIRESPRKHIRCVKDGDAYYYEIVALVPTNSLPGWYRSTIMKVYKDLALIITVLHLSKESINIVHAFTLIEDTDKSLVGATLKVRSNIEINTNSKSK